MTLVPGALVGSDYRIERPLAQGGMGAVYVATQLSTGRKRALKVMHALLVGDAVSQQRFLEEARIGSQIESEHVVEVVGAGIDDATGLPWLAMELLEGETLADRVARGPLTAEALAPLMRGLRHGLGRAHALGIVHRDLKPENLFIARGRGESGAESLKILDFGIAKLLQGGKTAATQNVAGSPLWMAPEQADAQAIRHATDVWALGLIAFDALVGQPYWRSAGDGSTLTRLLVEILTEPLEPASTRAAALAGDAGAARLPAQFDAFFARAVTRDSYARFDNADDALSALDDVLTGAPMRAFDSAPFSSQDALAQTALSVPPPSGASATGSAAAPSASFRRTASTEPAPAPASVADTRSGGAPRAWGGVVAGVIVGLGIAALAAAVFIVRGAGQSGEAHVAAPPLTSPTETLDTGAGARGDAPAGRAPGEPIRGTDIRPTPAPRAQTGGSEGARTGRDTPGSAAAARAAAPDPSASDVRARVGADSADHPASDARVIGASGGAGGRASARGAGASSTAGAPPPSAPASRSQGTEARRFRATIIAPCWRDNAAPDAAPATLTVVLGFGGAGQVATVRIDGTSDANVRRCIVMRGSSYRMSEPPREPSLTVRARVP